MPYSGRPAQPRNGLVAALAGGAQEPVLLERVDDLVEPDDVRLERGHVGEQQRQALLPAVGQVADVEGRDVQAVHGAPSAVRSRAVGRGRGS